MLKHSLMSVAIASAFALPTSATAADTPELAAIRAQIAEMKQSYEARLQALEQRLQEAQAAVAEAQNAVASAQQTAAPAPAAPVAAAAPVAPVAPAAPAGRAGDNSFNPSISLVLGGTFNNLQRDPGTYRFGGFMPPEGEIGPGSRSFNLGESELTMAANIDPMFAGQLTFALTGENEAEVEEAFFTTRELGGGMNLKAGRFLSGVGYLNGQHSHTWDFVDAPLAYQAFFGGQYKPDGVQARWLAPLNTFLEVGAEVGSGRSYPGNDRNKNGFNATSVFAHAGDDIGASSSWRAGVSFLRTGALDRAYEFDGIPNAFSGSSKIWMADAVYKWAPNGNPTQTNFKLQGEYMRRKESGTLASGELADGYASTQSGWYLQGVYQFMPAWRAGLRYDRLSSGSPFIGLVESGALGMEAFPALASYKPKRSSVMLDWSPSEFSRLRLQFARDEARPGQSDNQVFLQYIMSLGAHAGHTF
jgi:phosphate-selective porin